MLSLWMHWTTTVTSYMITCELQPSPRKAGLELTIHSSSSNSSMCMSPLLSRRSTTSPIASQLNMADSRASTVSEDSGEVTIEDLVSPSTNTVPAQACTAVSEHIASSSVVEEAERLGQAEGMPPELRTHKHGMLRWRLPSWRELTKSRRKGHA